MNGFGPPDDGDDCCPCTFGKSCAYHAEQERRSTQEFREQAHREGWNPDGEVDEHMVGLMLTIETSPILSDRQKLAIRRIVWPVR